MRHLVPITIAAAVALTGCGGPQRVKSPPSAATSADTTSDATPSDAPNAAVAAEPEKSNEFQLKKSDTSRDAQGVTASKIKATATEAAMKFVVIDKDKGPIPGIVVSLTAPDGAKYYTEETDVMGYAEVLVPVGRDYELVFLTLGRKDIAAKVSVSNEKSQNIKLTLRYKRPPVLPNTPPERINSPRFVLKGVTFETGKATIQPESFPRLDTVLEFLAHKKSARIEISGHTDNVGDPKNNQSLSLKRAQYCRDYLITKGIAAKRIEAIGYGGDRPIASNDSEEGRQLNRRIEATELQ